VIFGSNDPTTGRTREGEEGKGGQGESKIERGSESKIALLKLVLIQHSTIDFVSSRQSHTYFYL
jgi:hypothetical protein